MNTQNAWRNILGKFKGDAVDQHRESVEQDELEDLMDYIAYVPDHKGLVSETRLRQCRQCKQYWHQFTEPGGKDGHEVYTKTTLDAFKSQFPNAVFKKGNL